MSRRRTGLIRRPRRSTPASLLALAVLAVCVLAAVSVIQQLVEQPPVIPLAALDNFGKGLHTNDTVMIAAGAAAAALGLILVTSALLPGRPNTLPLGGVTPATAGDDVTNGGTTDPSADGRPVAGWHQDAAAGVSRSGLRVALRTTAADADAVDSARVQVRRRRVKASIRTETRDTDAVRATVTSALGRRLERAGLADDLKLQIKVKRRRRRSAA